MKTMPKDKEVLTVEEAIGYFCLSRRKFMEVLKKENDFTIKYYNSRRLIQKKKFEAYLSQHPEIRRRV